jgi:phospholipid/cholesterol/gamma-HCH transport system substrate-binding protein
MVKYPVDREPAEGGSEEEEGHRLRRWAAVAALSGTVLIVAYLLLLGGASSEYTVTAHFESAAQLVNGNRVDVAGVPAGTIKEITLADDGQALVKMEITDESYTPLPVGTKATIRSQSLSGIANRYVDLDLPATSQAAPTDTGAGEPEAIPRGIEGSPAQTIESGGTIEQVDTTSEVDLDQLFNTLNKRTVDSLKNVIKGFARAYDGVGPQANKGFYYFNPFLSTSRRVFGELNADQRSLESLIVDAASLTSAVSERAPDLSQLISNLNGMMGTIGAQEQSLASAVGQLPDFMRQFDTTAVNLRAALDDVDPLITATRPVARKLQPFVKRLRGFAHDAVPTVQGLNGIINAPGAANDLIDLNNLQVPLTQIAVGPVTRNGASHRGALPESAQALADGLPQISTLRAYSPDLVGWFDDFGHSGFPDAFGGIGRISTTLNAFTLGAPGAPIQPCNDTVKIILGFINPMLPGVCQAADSSELQNALSLQNLRRCPGANERGQSDSQLTQNGTIDCNPNQRPVGP